MKAGARKFIAAVAAFSVAFGTGIFDWPTNTNVAQAKGGHGKGGGHSGSHGKSSGSHGNSGNSGGNSGNGGSGGHGDAGGSHGKSGGSHGNSGGGSGNNGEGKGGGAAGRSQGSSASASPGQAKKAAREANRGQAKKAEHAPKGEKSKDSAAAARQAAPRQHPARSPIKAKAVTIPPPIASPFAVTQKSPHIRQARHEIVVEGLTPNDLADLRGLGFLTLRNFKSEKVARLHLPRGESLAQAKAAIAKINPAATADANHFYYPAGETCSGSGCVGFALVKWPVADQASEGCGSVPVIGMVDTAVNLSDPALQGQDIETLDGTEGDRLGDDGHGTSVASLLVGKPGSRQPGLLPHARLLTVDAFDRDGGPEVRSDAATLVDSIDRLVEHGARVINLSLAGPDNAVLERAIARAQAQGVVVVAAAGNEGPGAEPAYPAAYADVLAVTAVDQQLVVYRRANRGDYIDFAAPGVALASATPNKPESGTSFATPFVSAAAALILASQPELSLTDVRAELAARALDLGAPGRDSVYGWGLIQADNLCSHPTPIIANDLDDPDHDVALVGEETLKGGE